MVSTFFKSKLVLDGLKRIKPGGLIYIEDQGTYKILTPSQSISTSTIIPVENLEGSHKKRDLNIFELEILEANGVQVIYGNSIEEINHMLSVQHKDDYVLPQSTVDPKLLQRAERIVEGIKLINQMLVKAEYAAILNKTQFLKNEAVGKICSILSQTHQYRGLGRTNYYRYSSMLASCNGDVARLADMLHRSSFGKTKKSKAELLLVDTVIIKHFAFRGIDKKYLPNLYSIVDGLLMRTQGWWVDPDKCKDIPLNLIDELMDFDIPIELILNNLEKSAFLSKVSTPSASWLYRHFKWFVLDPNQGKKNMIDRWGKEFYESNWLAFDIFCNISSTSLENCFADHCELDFLITDEKSRTKAFKVWLTVIIDCFTRCVLGFSLSERAPCIESIQSAIENAIWDKTRTLDELGLSYEISKGWECRGIPVTLSLDNAWCHHSHSLEQLCKNISLGGQYSSIDLVFRPPYCGRYGAIIERFFGNLQAKIKAALPDAGAIRKISHDEIRNAAREARLLFTDIKKQIVELIVLYHHTPHSELHGMTPHMKWVESLEGGWPQVPPHTEANERLFWRSSPEVRSIGSRGVSVFGLDYWSEELCLLPRVGTNGKKMKYSFSYKPDDISRIALFGSNGFLCDLCAKQLKRPDGTYFHVSLAELRFERKLAPSTSESNRAYVQYLFDSKKLSETRKKEKQQAIKTAHKRNSNNSQGSITLKDSSSNLEKINRFFGNEPKM